jgi:hypothetical protein
MKMQSMDKLTCCNLPRAVKAWTISFGIQICQA